jgi:uncharacterized damage-inducible protein DinB
MNVETLKTMCAYHKWGNDKVWACVEKLSEDQYKADHDYSHGSVEKQCFHLMGTDWYLLHSMTNTMSAPHPKLEDYPTRAMLRAKWDEIEGELDAYLNTLTNEALQAEISTRVGEHSVLKATAWEFLMTNVNHGTNHRAQILALIFQHGGETVEQGFFFHLMERVAVAG